VDVVEATRASVEQGVWLRPFRDLVYTMPPYLTDDEDIARISQAAVAAAHAGAGGR
jgi:adenosylmethionine-8-amino-7-oxononanoate aminotransferase